VWTEVCTAIPHLGPGNAPPHKVIGLAFVPDYTRPPCPPRAPCADRLTPTDRRRQIGSTPAGGGAAFAQSLSRLGLVDEYRLVLQPVALGDGLPLFKDLSAPIRLELIDAQTYKTGAALHVYRPAPAMS
jgi:hypothetical protein